jgi:hypothetical protein
MKCSFPEQEEKKKYGSFKYKMMLVLQLDNKPLKYMLANMKMQQNESLQQQ